jgi:divinyl protochlorophyllide a 8-vinyl-reductase
MTAPPARTPAPDASGSHAADLKTRVGPNAVIQLADVLADRYGAQVQERVFARAGELAWLWEPPAGMVPQQRAARLHRALRDELPGPQALSAAREAGVRTAHYLLRHRIPKPAQLMMRLMGAPLAARALMALIRANAWTFAGSGQLTTHTRPVWAIEIRDNPLAGNPCTWHEGVFETLFRTLVAPDITVRETSCCGGDPALPCRFEITRLSNHPSGELS